MSSKFCLITIVVATLLIVEIEGRLRTIRTARPRKLYEKYLFLFLMISYFQLVMTFIRISACFYEKRDKNYDLFYEPSTCAEKCKNDGRDGGNCVGDDEKICDCVKPFPSLEGSAIDANRVSLIDTNR